MTIIETRSVRKVFESGRKTVTALSDVSLEINSGTVTAIMGPSGSGKSTLLSILGLLDTPTDGRVFLAGTDVTDLSDRERTNARKDTIGFIFQQYYLIPALTARENVELPGLIDSESEQTHRAAALLTEVGLGDRLEHRPSELSGGQKQRVAIARALVNEPRILLADEPTGNLDRATSRRILEQFTAICERGVAIIVVTHDPLVSEYVDRTIDLIDGELAPADASTETHSHHR